MAEAYNNWERFYHKYNILFNGLVALPLIPFGYVFLETQKEFPDEPLLMDSSALILEVVLIVISVASMIFSHRYKRKVMEEVGKQEAIPDKLKVFLSEKTRQYMILEIASICSIVGLYLTKNQLFSVVFIAVIFVYSLSRPTFDSVVRELKVSVKAMKEWGDQVESK